MKTHKTAVIRMRELQDMYACSNGIARCYPLLPAVVSTDPEQNIELAFDLFEIGFSTGRDVVWLLGSLGGEFVADYSDTWNLAQCEPYVVAQMLAWIADIMCTREGR